MLPIVNMEYLRDEEEFLFLKIQTHCPEKILPEVRYLNGFRGSIYKRERSLLILIFSSENTNKILLELDKALPDAEIVETSLSPFPYDKGYRKRITDHITIASPECAKRGDIALESLFSFGSGLHPTTEICIHLLERVLTRERIERVLDLGTGSGILALVCRKLGVKEIIGLDIDFKACKEAMENIKRNGRDDGILIACGSYHNIKEGFFDLLVANLISGILLSIAPDLCNMVKRGGYIILSGFTEEQGQEILRHIKRYSVIESFIIEGWKGVLLNEK